MANKRIVNHSCCKSWVEIDFDSYYDTQKSMRIKTPKEKMLEKEQRYKLHQEELALDRLIHSLDECIKVRRQGKDILPDYSIDDFMHDFL